MPVHEPKFQNYIDIKPTVKQIIHQEGEEKRDLILQDNNVLASDRFEDIIHDIKDLGFRYGETFNGKHRSVDYNQGLDARLLDDKKAKLLSEICINPARVAFDDIRYRQIYENAIRRLAENNVVKLSNYLLWNFNDKPRDLYTRIKINIRLNEKYSTEIFSFPMRFIPLNAKKRTYRNTNYWSKKQIRAIQVILIPTHGVVGPGRKFVMEQFGNSVKEFEMLLWMPEYYIMYRKNKMKDLVEQWENEYYNLSKLDKKYLKMIISENEIDLGLLDHKCSSKLKRILKHYTYLIEKTKRKNRLSSDQYFLFDFEKSQRQIAPSCS